MGVNKKAETLVVCVLQDPRVERIPCTHKGTYADDCICERVKQHKCYIVATCDRDLRRRIRKVRWNAQGQECGCLVLLYDCCEVLLQRMPVVDVMRKGNKGHSLRCTDVLGDILC